MLMPIDYLQRYRNIKVKAGKEDEETQSSRLVVYQVKIGKYFMMDWDADSEERKDFNTVTRGSRRNEWYRENKPKILNAAMGKGAPEDYELALEWAVRAGRISHASKGTIQAFADDHLGIDCSGFVTNYLIAAGKMMHTDRTVRNTNAASYFSPQKAVNDASAIRPGDLLVWMRGNQVKRRPGHIAVVQSYVPASRLGGNMQVVEATGSRNASPKLLDSMYKVEHIHRAGVGRSTMILEVKRHGRSGSRVSVMRY
ncbi:MAG: CHAP domain-containing protein [Gammaproteobacteria bacterium]|nr:CHAP domain-containing protein [Gammaproteobacteria bacterium]